jgi:hypothetical protein
MLSYPEQDAVHGPTTGTAAGKPLQRDCGCYLQGGDGSSPHIPAGSPGLRDMAQRTREADLGWLV